MIERIVSWGLDAPAKFAPTLEVRKSNARLKGSIWLTRGGVNRQLTIFKLFFTKLNFATK